MSVTLKGIRKPALPSPTMPGNRQAAPVYLKSVTRSLHSVKAQTVLGQLSYQWRIKPSDQVWPTTKSNRIRLSITCAAALTKSPITGIDGGHIEQPKAAPTIPLQMQ